MPTIARYGRRIFAPAMVAGIVAVLGMIGFFFIALGPGHDPEGHGDGMISTTAVYQAGASITPSAPSR